MRSDVWARTFGALAVSSVVLLAVDRPATAQVEGGEQPAPAPAPAPSPPPAPDGAPPAPPAPDGAPPAPEAAAPPAPPPTPPPHLVPIVSERSPAPSADSLDSLVGPPAETRLPRSQLDLPATYAERGYLVAPTLVFDRGRLYRGSPRGLGERLQLVPQQGNAANAQLNNGGDGPTRLSLRSLGAGRTATLIDGRPVVASGLGADDAVDYNLIPLAMIERVELRTDGDSVRYGSGAIGGTINLIPRQRIEASEASLTSGLSSRGDGARYDASLVTGLSGRRGDLVLGLAYQGQQAVRADARTFSATDELGEELDGTPIPSLSDATPDGRINTASIDTDGDGDGDRPNLCGLSSSGLPALYCTPDGLGGLRPYTEGDRYNFQPENFLITPSQRLQLTALGTLRLTHRTRAFAELWAASATSEQRLAADPLLGAPTISRLSVYNPIAGDISNYYRRLTESGPRRAEATFDSIRFVAGVEGRLGGFDLGEWTWQLSATHGRARTQLRQYGFHDTQRLALALGPSFLDADGVARCGSPAAPIASCVPVNLLAGASAGAVTRGMLDYIGVDGVSAGDNQQTVLHAETAGRLLELPSGGDLGLQLGADYRRDAGSFTPDSLIARGDTTAASGRRLDGANDAGSLYATAFAQPLQRELGLVEELALEAGVRLTSHDSFRSPFENGLAWKLGAQLRARPGISLYATYRSSFRAASLAERFTAASEGFDFAADPCMPPLESAGGIQDLAGQCAAQGVPAGAPPNEDVMHPVRRGGRSQLDSERAAIFSAGLSVEPPARPGLRLAASYFRTEITDRITAPSLGAIFTQCYERGDQRACARIRRDPDRGFTIASIDERVGNGGGFTTSGVDFSAAYPHRLGPHVFTHQLDGVVLFDYLADDLVEEKQGRGHYDLGVHPRLTARLESTWEYQRYGAGAALRFLSGFDECAEPTTTKCHEVSSSFSVDLHGRYRLDSCLGATDLELGVTNAFDEAPPTIYSGNQSDSDAATYDYMGRFVYARVTQQF